MWQIFIDVNFFIGKTLSLISAHVTLTSEKSFISSVTSVCHEAVFDFCRKVSALPIKPFSDLIQRPSITLNIFVLPQ